jgi:hypothetical protein
MKMKAAFGPDYNLVTTISRLALNETSSGAKRDDLPAASLWIVQSIEMRLMLSTA